MIIAFSGQAFKRIQPHLHHIRTHLSKYIIRSMSAKPTSSLLDCQLDSYKMEGTSRVVSCVQKDATYHVVLEDSVLYPEGGGQPWDFGSVAGMKVEKVVKGPTNKQVLVELPNPLEEGSEVTCSIDWSRRYDFMQQHTAQHLFSAVADKLFKAETTGWALGAEMVSVDLSTPVLLTAAQIQDIETETNRMVASGAAVNWKMFTKEQILSIGNSGAQSGADDTSELSLLRGGPKGAALELDELRMVHIDGLDLNPCGGTHLRSLSEINVLKVMGFDKDNNRGCVRVRFLAGQRALNYFRDCIGRETFLSSQLSVPPAQHPEAIEKLLKEKRDNAKRMDIYAEELAELFALSLLVNPEKALNCKVADGVASLPETPVYAYHRPGADLKFLVKAAGTLLAAYQKQNPSSKTSPLVYLSGDEQMPVYVSAVEPPKGNAKAAKKPAAGKGGKAAEAEGGSKAAEGGLSGAFVLFGTEALVQQLKEPLVGVISGKGGGRPGRLQGTAVGLEAIEEVRKLLGGSVVE